MHEKNKTACGLGAREKLFSCSQRALRVRSAWWSHSGLPLPAVSCRPQDRSVSSQHGNHGQEAAPLPKHGCKSCSSMEHHVKPYPGQKKLTQITPANLRKLYDTLKERGRVHPRPGQSRGLSSSTTVHGIHICICDAIINEKADGQVVITGPSVFAILLWITPAPASPCIRHRSYRLPEIPI